jgi:hypothetical protein
VLVDRALLSLGCIGWRKLGTIAWCETSAISALTIDVSKLILKVRDISAIIEWNRGARRWGKGCNVKTTRSVIFSFINHIPHHFTEYCVLLLRAEPVHHISYLTNAGVNRYIFFTFSASLVHIVMFLQHNLIEVSFTILVGHLHRAFFIWHFIDNQTRLTILLIVPPFVVIEHLVIILRASSCCGIRIWSIEDLHII